MFTECFVRLVVTDEWAMAAGGNNGATRRRGGGRSARRKLREVGPAQAPVRAGLKGGAFKPLSERDIQRIHQTALDVLANVGVADPPPEMLEIALEKGCTLGDDGRLRFPRAFVEDIVAGACREMTIFGRDPGFDINLRGTDVSYSTAGQAVSIYESASRSYRASTLLDLYDLARLVDRLDHIHRLSVVHRRAAGRGNPPALSDPPRQGADGRRGSPLAGLALSDVGDR